MSLLDKLTEEITDPKLLKLAVVFRGLITITITIGVFFAAMVHNTDFLLMFCAFLIFDAIERRKK